MANSIAFAKNYTGIIDEVYKRASVSGCLTSSARMVRAGYIYTTRSRATSLGSTTLFARSHLQ